VTPLISAVEWGYAEVVELLVANDADLSAQDDYGRTALTVASDLNHTKIVSLLQTAGLRGEVQWQVASKDEP
jgi:ankyrin repeat protein